MEHPRAPVPALMYPAAQVDAHIARVEATITRLQAELATALERLAAAAQAPQAPPDEVPPQVGDEERDQPAAAAIDQPGPDGRGVLLEDFLDALHEPGSPDPSSPDGQEGNFW